MKTCPTTEILDQNGTMMRVNTSDLDYYLAKEGYRLAKVEEEIDDQLETEEIESNSIDSEPTPEDKDKIDKLIAEVETESTEENID